MPVDKTYKVKALHIRCEYLRNAYLFKGRKVKIVEEGTDGKVWITFVFSEDAQSVNKANDWSCSKNKYLLYKPTLEEVVRKKKMPSEWQPVKGFEGIYERNCKGVIRTVKK